MSAKTSELNRQVAVLHEEFRLGRMSESVLVSACAFRQLVESYVFGNFWRKYRDFVRETARNLDAEDLLAPAMMAVLAGFKDYDESRGLSLHAYLTLKMYQACRQEVRKNYPRASWEVSAPAPIHYVPFDGEETPPLGEHRGPPDPVAELDRALLLDSVDQLPEELRRVVYLYHFEGRSFAEIGRSLDVHTSTVKRQFDRALRALKPILEELGLGMPHD